ncbi:diacylglycerol kinase family enzyme [Herbihabitans rhizosphaerae]|uniref:Diacylglycerol kinase family enzyme n=1 Tax=Herbihabitans rhizosphaerae TaxID=1872711 RepID=A0A4Q7KGQ2_9PSEU|nr:diacylglycerol kinase family protein [Herbihabitans rhizosphaerae]RZS34038.1 diacylglycerol kinase family enzyme [Herbihabitans rhizosphaerae]
MRAVLVVNPQATATTPAGRDVLAHALASEVKLDVVETDYRGHAMVTAAQAAEDGTDLVVAHGGDGTVNEVVNGLLAGRRTGGPALGVVPGGSANVFARALGLPCTPVEATHRLLHAIEEGRSRQVGLGQVRPDGAGARWFTFNAGVGWDADVVADVDRKRGKKTSPTLYARVAVARYLRQERKAPRMTVQIPGEEAVEGLRTVFVSNTDPWSYLGNRPVHLNAGCTFDGGLGLFALRSLAAPTVLRHLSQALSKRGEQRGRRMVRHDDVQAIRVVSERPMRVQVDGDLLGEHQRVDFLAVPHALSVVA